MVMEPIYGLMLLVALWYAPLALTFAGYAGCAWLSGVPQKKAFKSCSVVIVVWGLLPWSRALWPG